MLDIEPKGHQGRTSLRYFAYEAVHLLSVEQKLPGPGWLMVAVAGSIVAGDMAVEQPQLAVFWLGVGIPQVYPASPDRFDLRTPKDNARLEAFLDMIVVVSFAIGAYHPGVFCHRRNSIIRG